MADRHADVLLAGGGVASAACAKALREGGFEGSIALVGREPDPPYNRPPASKGYLAGKASKEDALYLPESWYTDHGVDLLTRTSVMKLDPQDRTAKLSTRERWSFGRALVATGANVRRLNVDGVQLDGLHYLRALRNADAIRSDCASAERVVLVGGSYIASELAATLTTLGASCTMLMQEALPLSAGFGETAGRFFEALLRERGVEVCPGEEVVRFEGPAEGRVERVVCASGRVVEAPVVVLGVGAVPDVMLARGAGLELGELGGVRCDARLRTSAEDVWAAGDMCEYDSVVHGRRLRIEHWDVAIEQGRTVAANMLGQDRPHEAIPYFWSDLADWASLEYVGPAQTWDREIVRGSLDDGAFTIFYLEGGRVGGALTVGRPADLDLARRLMRSGEDVSRRVRELENVDGEVGRPANHLRRPPHPT